MNQLQPEELLPRHYDELKRLAASYMNRERGDHTLQPTALVHEVYLKLADRSPANWEGRSHFIASCAQAMRRILIDHARARGRAKRGADWLSSPSSIPRCRSPSTPWR